MATPVPQGSTGATGTSPLQTRSTPNADDGRFLAGTVLANRYRIISLLGRGGMGEVYRATDLLLEQTVALKFLPSRTARDSSALERLRNEVRMARQVSHPNVCRVYDIGEADGQLFLSMEYVDGEDLSSLLRRIGHLPHDKALEVVRKLCAGLAAAHDKGVLHRDLKPANIMLDGHGQVRVMDFGLAAFAEEARDVRSGTPAYMSPEQKAGREVTTRSDIYSLGVVVHEIYTGRRPSEKSSSKAELDPGVAAVVDRCLAEDPLQRPASALAVVAALPGGDPLAAALAAGETPSPEMVAKAGPVEGMSVRWAIACAVSILAGVVAWYPVYASLSLADMMRAPDSPDVLAGRAREYIQAFGYKSPPTDMAMGWEYNDTHLQKLSEEQSLAKTRRMVETLQPPVLTFWYRQHPRFLYSYAKPEVTRKDPWLVPDSLQVVMDPHGQLLEFHAAAAARKPYEAAPAPDWSKLFSSAGLDIAGFQPTKPQFTPKTAYDLRQAWRGVYPASPATEVHVEAAAYEGKVSSFRVVTPTLSDGEAGARNSRWVLVYMVILPLWGAIMAWRNVVLDRADWNGALRLGIFCSFVNLLRELLVSHHAAATEGWVLWKVMREASVTLFFVTVLYLAFEPYVRRRMPRTMVSWSRLLEGRWRDSHVGSDILTGLVGWALMCSFLWVCTLGWDIPPAHPILAVSVSDWLAGLLWTFVYSVGGGLSMLLMLALVRFALRRTYLAAAVLAMVLALVATGAFDATRLAVSAAFHGILFVLMGRFGLVAATTFLFAFRLVEFAPATMDFARWYAWQGVCAALTVVTLGAFAFWTNLGGRPLWTEVD